MSDLKQHFDKVAENYDKEIYKTFPRYDEMIEALVNAIPTDMDSPKVLDLGCGTGNITKKVLEVFPNAKVTCLDISDKMIEISKEKLSGYDIEYVLGDFTIIDIIDNYDVIISSLALHHIKTDEEKLEMYKYIFNALNDGGVFYNADVVKSDSPYNTELNERKYIEYMQSKNATNKEIEDFKNRRNDNDSPITLFKHFNLLEEVGFSHIDVIWKYYGNAVFGATKIE
ncbi:MAG: methyltransferase domain-containing protein [Methanosphaera stadtmanae]|nr:methyltransferase domain-containing protein [Methanosphaera stadtmanae]